MTAALYFDYADGCSKSVFVFTLPNDHSIFDCPSEFFPLQSSNSLNFCLSCLMHMTLASGQVC